MRSRLLWKLGGTFLLLIALVLLAVDLYVARTLREEAMRTGFEQLETLARLAESRPPASAETEALREWATWMSRSGARVTVIASEGAVLADSERDPAQLENHSDRPEIQQAFAQGSGRSVRYSDSVGRDLLYLAQRRTLPGRDSPLVVRFATPLAQVDQAVALLRARLWGASLVILLLAGAAALLYSRALAGRIGKLEQFAHRVAEGDFRPLPVERQGDELTQLGHALNETAARLEQSFRSLTDERNRSAAILRSMIEGVAVIGPDGRVLFLNEAFCRELAVDPARGEGRPMVEVVRHSDLLSVVQRALAGEAIARTEIAIGSTGAQRFFAATAGPVRPPGRDERAAEAASRAERYGAVLVLHDISELRRLERVRRDFVANVSHEFKTPLTAIQGFAETLLGGALNDAANRSRFLEIIREHAARLARLTDDLLKLSSIEAGKLDLDFRPVNVADLIESCVETTRFRAGQKQLALAVECPAELPKVRGDARRLAEILQNLLDNAVQYTPEGGRITVRASSTGSQPVHADSQAQSDSAQGRPSRSDGSWVRISVSDTGIGIPRDQQQRIFERFYRVDAARSREAGGTGLGLSIARHLAEAHGGRVEVESEVGRGSTFALVLPAA